MSAYAVYKTIHIVGVIVLVGNVTATAVWKVFADRSENPQVVAFAQRLVTLTDWMLTLPRILLIVVGGFGTAAKGGIPPFSTTWLRVSELLFVVSGAIWALILVPIQLRQSRSARIFEFSVSVPASYRRDARRWLWWGISATILLLIAVVMMIAKV
jgi:uncharacterized membrane protein